MNSGQWGKRIIDQLIKQGVDTFCISPGSRSTPLAIAVAEHPEVKAVVHFDERGSGFYALGYAKGAKKAAAVITTSGTAVGNLMPAVMEASMSHTPLLVLTADRPKELYGTMANQTCDQTKIFGDYVRLFIDLPAPFENPQHYLSATLSHALSQTDAGPVHINCPFPEPFFGSTPDSSAYVTYPKSKPIVSDIAKYAEMLNRTEKGFILIGSYAGEPLVHLKAVAQKLKWPLFPDIISSYRSEADPNTIPYFPLLVKAHPHLKADLLLHLGDQFVSKNVLNWMESHRGKPVIRVADNPLRSDPRFIVTDNLYADLNLFCEQLLPYLDEREEGWVEEWQELSKQAEQCMEFSGVTEPGVIKMLEKSSLPLFIGNSMPIRDADTFFFPKKARGAIYANRGLSGIDGNIATCAGLAQHHPLIAVMGDQTFLYDLNSLPLIKKSFHPIKLIVINNGGGGIFSFLPFEKEEPVRERFFAAAHSMDFAHAAHLFQIPYSQNLKALEEEGSCLIEIQTNRSENYALHKAIEERLCSFSTVS